METTTMKDIRNKNGKIRSIYLPLDLSERLDGLAEKGAVTSNVVAVCVRQALPGIEKKFETWKTTGLRVRKTK
jgi:predicted DNA-binding protein